jgi:Site-specific recombinases, DNA invertase Pin homologs
MIVILSVEILEFVDDGYSGTNFDRPAFKEMLRRIKSGEINCVIVKDFSRFGRNSIDVAHYLEKVFPLLFVRFISVSNGYDSDNFKGRTGGLNVAMDFFKNEFYSRDLSQKIRSAVRAKAMRGEYIRSCSYGYRLTENRELVLDEQTAPVAREIFELALSETSPCEIRNKLHDRVKLTTGKIIGILSNECYTGEYVYGKTKPLEVGSKVRIACAESEWIRISAHHPAIVTVEEFAKVQEWIKQFQRAKANKVKKLIPKIEEECHVVVEKATVDAANDEQQRLYEQFVSGEITKEEYAKLKASA